ncbi:carbamoyltransferase C-terminal domain-containing protein [Bryobacter aggregatus]|uniref:carbamoyltransferase C-terminal domain-containing protein n=1 Tax=Bryobacter aggregatus TaxID=360054 RepID=UPI0004E1E045|nr:carbamoyltransferase C-terminal domain-containing protein [Bryobacter aggregatus]
MKVIGLGGLLDDAACALAVAGKIVAAVEQKKVARRHVAWSLPLEAIDATLSLARVDASDVDVVAIARPLSATPDSLLSLRVKQIFPKARLLVVDHHTAHAASAYFASGFDEASVLCLDRAGDLRCSSRWKARGDRFELEQESYFPDSLGDLYGRVTEFLGFTARADEHKVQWMSAGGDTRFVALFEEILGFRATGWPALERSFFDRDRLGSGGFSARFYQALGLADGESPLPKLQPHLAAGLQRAIENCALSMAGRGGNLCLAGGVAFNTLLVRSLEASGQFQNVYVQPAAGNAGTAIGAAYLGSEGKRQPMSSLALGPSFQAEETKQILENCKLSPKFLLTTDELIQSVLSELKEQRIVAWFQDRMEFGPRALGNRSILASPLDPYATENLNSFIKHREAFRKFAASVPAEDAAQYFEFGPNAKNLASIATVRPEYRERFAPALLGADSIRLHVVEADENPLFHRLLKAAGAATGLPVLYNTSFNLFGDALVCNPRDAVRSFYSSGIDVLYVGHFLLRK